MSASNLFYLESSFAGDQDKLFPLAGVKQAFEKISKVYTEAGYGDLFYSKIREGKKHEFTEDMQKEAFERLNFYFDNAITVNEK